MYVSQIIFVISTHTLLARMYQQHTQDSLDENRILSELKGLEQQLTYKSTKQQNTLAMSKAQQKFNSFAKYPHLQQQDHAFLQHINNIQYFSQINNQEMEEDSLFEHQMKLFAHPHTNKNKASNKSIKENTTQIGRSKGNSNKQNKNEQIIKEQEYIFRKEKGNISKTTKPMPCKSKPVRNSKQSKNSTMTQNENHYTHNYLIQQDSSQHVKNTKQVRMKTQQPYYLNNIDAYLEQIANEQIPKIAQENKSKSRIKTDEHSLECTFKPKILQKSKQMVKSTKNVVERLSVNNNNNKNNKAPYQPTKPNPQRPKMERIEQLSQPRKQKVIEPQQQEQLPSFKPQLSKKSLTHMSNCTYDVATRNKLWLQQKEEKINRMRKEQEEEKLKKQECTHSPAIKVYRGEQDIQFSKFGKQGMVQYFERLSMMKKKRSISNLKRQETTIRDEDCSISDKQKANMNMSRQKSFSNLYKSKKQTYEQAVKSLHSKIMKLKI